MPADERVLIKRARQGDLAAFNQLVADYQDAVYNQALSLLGDPARAEAAAPSPRPAAWRC